MALQSVGASGWEARPLQSKAAVSVASGVLSATQVLEIAVQASAAVEDREGWLRPGERSANKLSFTVRDMVREGNEPVLHFDVEVDRAVGRVTARTVITSYTVKSSGMSALVPVPRRKIAGFTAYRTFMETYARMLRAADPSANVSFSGD